MTKITNSIWLLIFVIFLILTLISGFKVFKSISPIYLVYLFIFLGGLVLSTLMTFIVKDKSQKKNYLLLLTSLFISLTLIEFVLEKSNNLKVFKNFFYSKIYNVDFDHRDKIDVIKQDPESKPSMHILSDKFIHSGLNKFNLVPLSGVTNSTTILCNEIGYWAKYKSDRYGFRNNDVIWDKNDIEYLVIGDSYAHGACVKNENTISFNLSKLSNKNSINLGIGGNGPIMSYAALREFGIQKTPKKIIWIFNISDLSDLDYELNNETISKYFYLNNFSQNLKNKTSQYDLLYNKIINKYLENENNFFKFINIRKQLNVIINIIFGNNNTRELINENQFQNFKSIANKINNLSNLNNSKLYVVYIPIHWEYSKSLKSYKKYRSKVIDFFNKKNISLIDLHELKWSKEENPFKNYVFELNLHYTPETYNEISKIIYENSLD